MGPIVKSLFFAAALAGLGFWACTEEPLSGTSVSIGNPTKVGLVFIEERAAGRIKVSGEISLYLSRQVPMLDSQPLLTYRLQSQDSFDLVPEMLMPFIGTRRVDSMIGIDSGSLFFNLYVSSLTSGGYLIRDLRFLVREKTFWIEGAFQTDRLPVYIQPPIAFEGKVEIKDRDSIDYDYFVYSPGTPFFSKIDSAGTFEFEIPKGNYKALMAKVSKGGGPVIKSPKIWFYELSDSIQTVGQEKLIHSPPFDSLYSHPLP